MTNTLKTYKMFEFESDGHIVVTFPSRLTCINNVSFLGVLLAGIIYPLNIVIKDSMSFYGRQYDEDCKNCWLSCLET